MGFINRSLRMAIMLTMVATLVALTAGVASAAGPKEKVVYSSVPGNLPGNVSSLGYEATSTSEFGDTVTLAAGPRKASSVEVVMSSFGCQSGTWHGGDCATAKNATFTHPITLNLYAVDGSGEPGALLTSSTQNFAIPYRPSADAAKCTGADAGKWYSKPDKTCYNGFATKITFMLDGTQLPDNVIWTVAYNTTNYGSDPIGPAGCGSNCGYDSLNVGTETFSGQPSKGADTDPDDAVLNSAWGGAYCDNGLAGTGTLRLDSGCWTGLTPLATIRTK